MLQPDVKSILLEVKVTCEEIAEVAGPQSESYLNDRVHALAVERLLMNLGEALTRLSRLDPDSFDAISGAREVIRQRNILAHGYDVVSPSRVAQALAHDMPILFADVESLLAP